MSEPQDKKTENSQETPFDRIIKENPMPQEVKEFLDKIEKAAGYEAKLRIESKAEALSNISKLREATKAYLEAIKNMMLPSCYVESLALYINALQFYHKEFLEGTCFRCNFKIGVIQSLFKPPEALAAAVLKSTLSKVDDIEKQPAAEAPQPTQEQAAEDKKINIYDTSPEAEKNAKEATAAAEIREDEEIVPKLQDAKAIANARAALENFEDRWQEYISFLKKTEPNLWALTAESIADDFLRYTLKDGR